MSYLGNTPISPISGADITDGTVGEVDLKVALASKINDAFSWGDHDGLYTPITTYTTTSTSKTLAVSEFCILDTASQTITLPASPSVGDTVAVGVKDFTDTIVARNGSNIASVAEDFTIDIANATFRFTYIDTTIGWRVY